AQSRRWKRTPSRGGRRRMRTTARERSKPVDLNRPLVLLTVNREVLHGAVMVGQVLELDPAGKALAELPRVVDRVAAGPAHADDLIGPGAPVAAHPFVLQLAGPGENQIRGEEQLGGALAGPGFGMVVGH